MGTISAPRPPQPKQDAKTSLIERILTRTREGKFSWEKVPNGYKGSTRDRSITASLTTAPAFLNGWSRFTVQSGGEELINYENSGLNLLTLSGVGRGGATEIIEDLVRLLEERSLQGVRDAINLLDRL